LESLLEAGGSVLVQVEDRHGGDAEVTRGWATGTAWWSVTLAVREEGEEAA
jgi:hypothetical protein